LKGCGLGCMIIRLPAVTRGVVGAAIVTLLCFPAAAQNCQSERTAVNDLAAKTRDLARLVRAAEAEADRMIELISDNLIVVAVLVSEEGEVERDLDSEEGARRFVTWTQTAQYFWISFRLMEQRRKQAAAAGLIALRQYTNMRALLLEARLQLSRCEERVARPTPPTTDPQPQPPPPGPGAGDAGAGEICAVKYHGWSVKEGTKQSEIVVSSGHACSRKIGIDTSGALLGLAVTSAPGNGRATVSGFTVTYRSNQGFRGKDTFTTTVQVRGKQGRQRSATIVWDVTVR
jgi:hypothetical protein